MNKRIKLQKIKIIQSRKDASHGEYSPYWMDVESHSRSNQGEGLSEHPQANPDILPETKIASPSTPQLLMGEAVQHLQGRQREVYMLLLRDGKSYADTAEILGIARGAVQVYEKRAIKFVTAYCKQAIVMGRV